MDDLFVFLVVSQGTDSTMLYKMNQQHKENKGYVSSKNEHDSQFGIKHFAGQVFYDSNGIQHITSRNGSFKTLFNMIGEVKELFSLFRILGEKPRCHQLQHHHDDQHIKE